MGVNKRNVSTWSGRPHDYLYDPCCILSSAKDHAKEANRAINNSCDLAFVPFYRRMFSELQNYPCGAMRLQNRKPIPWFISRRYRMIGSGAEETKVFPSTYNQITGPDMCKFIRRPQNFTRSNDALTALLYHLDYSVITTTSCDQLSECTDTSKPTIDQSTQTDFRESEAQTEPYTPTYRLQGQSEPEILTLASFALGNGLPVGENEILMIERARIKRNLEASLPPLTATNYRERIKQISEIEWAEWKYRDNQIQEIHDIKMELMKKLLSDEHDNFVNDSTKKMLRVWKNREIGKDKLVKKLNKFRFRENHKLLERKRQVVKKLSEYNKIDLHFDPGSEMYTPLLMKGTSPFKCRENQHSVECKYFNSFKNILKFEHYASKHFTTNFIQPVLPKLPETGYVKRKDKNSKQLNDAYKTMLVERGLSPIHRTFTGTMALMEKLEKPPPRPVTPEIRGPSDSIKHTEQSVIFLQKILRGRAIQILMHDGKERCADLIDELRTFHALYTEQQEHLDTIRVRLKQNTDQRVKLDKKETELESVIESLVGDKVAQILDYLSKELIRLQDERRIHALAILAERQRRLRQAEESGLRQTEERRRREEQEIFRNILNVHQKSIDLYLDEIINASIHHTVSQQAAYEMEAMARRINDTVHELEQKSNEIQSEEMIADLMHSFLLPEVERMEMREKVRRRQYAALKACHEFLYADMASSSTSGATTPPSPTLEPSKPKRSSKDLELPTKKLSRAKRPSVLPIGNWHTTESLEDWDVYAPGQLKYNQLRVVINYEEINLEHAEEFVHTRRRQSMKVRESIISVFKKSR
uniref:Cilia- and flagella-associated protein 91 n=1 Tax=Strigamia maritima TaxID=126957 RepID=T1IS81_STRMM